MHWSARHVNGKLWYDSVNSIVCVSNFLGNLGLAQSFVPVDFIFYILDGRLVRRGPWPSSALNPPRLTGDCHAMPRTRSSSHKSLFVAAPHAFNGLLTELSLNYHAAFQLLCINISFILVVIHV